MGIPRGTARLLLEEHRRRPFSGSLLQLGRSSVYLTLAEVRRWAARHGVALAEVGTPGRSHDPRLARQGCLDDVTFFSLLGFSEVRSCDVSGWEGADYIFDLNAPAPAELRGRFDAVFETGTTIQVFHLPAVLANVHAVLKPGGRVIHAAVPSNNHVDLGFYMFSPTLLHDFYSANGWRIEYEYLCEYSPYWHRGRLHSGPWKVYRYTPGCLDHLSYGRYGGRQAAIFLVATKTEGSTGGTLPQLGQYRRSWAAFAAGTGDRGAAAGEPSGEGGGRLRRRAEALLGAHPWLDRAYLPLKRLKERLRRFLPRRMPPSVGRY